ncbi:MAG TPA: trehalose-phosphatase [Phenylobacterium sp.]|nr:trehalose-phosphatase [Phenylobacterium sp.]
MSVAELTVRPEAPVLNLSDVALFLDLDGTLAPIVSRPDDVGPDPRRTGLLERLQSRLEGRLAVVSGRTLADLDRILETSVPALAGVHGLARRNGGGELSTAPGHPGHDAALAALNAFAADRPGLIVEDKGLSVALHYRLAPELAAAARHEAERVAARSGLTLQEGQMVAELRSPGETKGDSVRAFMAEPPFAGARPVFVGDDLTDEDGFLAAEALGGFGVLVGPPRPTAARFRLPDVETALVWLEHSQ